MFFAATERFSVEALLDPDLMADGFLKYVWKNMVTEGSEEGASNLLNSFADILISGDQSQWSQNVEYYRSQGYSDERAFEYALGDQALGLGLDVLGGMLSGGFLSGGYGAVNFASSRGDSRIARDDTAVGNVSMSQSNVLQELTATAHTPLERRSLSQYKNAVELLENRQRVLADTQNRLQQLAATGDVHSAEYIRLKSAELSLNRKVDDAQRKVDRLENGTSVKELRKKAENNQANRLEKDKVAQYNAVSHDDIYSLSLRFLSNRDVLYRNMDDVPEIAGYEDIVCHADPYSFGYIDPQTGETVQDVSAKEFAQRVRESGRYKGGPIRLISCESGRLDNGLAQQFADEMGVPVLAPTKSVWTNSQGYMVLADTEEEAIQLFRKAKEKWNPGGWRIFKPKGG